MTRHYYHAKQAHRAYYMASEFGMEFAKRFGKWEAESLVHLTGATTYKLYVHDDSNHLLVPQNGDVGIDDLGETFRHDRGGWRKLGVDGDPYRLPSGHPMIILRGGRPFCMPEGDDEVAPQPGD